MKINKTLNIVVDTQVGKTSSITVEEVVKKGIIFGPIMCCASTSKVNTIQEALKYQYGEVEIGMPVFMDDIAVVGTADNIGKRIPSCRRMKIEKKIIHGLQETKDHMLELNRKCEVINREISVIVAKQQVGKVAIRVKLKLYETCLIAQEIEVKIKNMESMSKSKWKKQVKEKIGNRIVSGRKNKA